MKERLRFRERGGRECNIEKGRRDSGGERERDRERERETFSLNVSTGTAPSLSVASSMTCSPAICALAALVPCADLGMRQIFRCCSPLSLW